MNIDKFLKDIPGKTMDAERVDWLKTIVKCLESDFTTALSHIGEIVPDYDRGCISVIFDTPYITSVPGKQEYLANLFRLADAVAFSITGSGDNMVGSIIFTVMIWE